jgi:hypothetical protein
MMPPPRRREEDQHWWARLNKLTGILTAISVLVGTLLGVYIAVGGQYTLPNDRVAKLEARIENNVQRIEKLEAANDSNGEALKLIRSMKRNIELLTVSKCRDTGVWPPSLEATCDSLRNIIPLR